MLRYLSPLTSSERRSQLVVREDASEGRLCLTIGCPLRVRSILSRPVEIIFLAEANATAVSRFLSWPAFGVRLSESLQQRSRPLMIDSISL